MQERVRQDVLSVLKRLYIAFKKNDAQELKALSDNTIHNAGIFQDKDSIRIAVVAYGLSKLFIEKNMQSKYFWVMKKRILRLLKSALQKLAKNDNFGYNHDIKHVFRELKKCEKEFGRFVTEVIQQAKIRKGSRVYEHGISAGRVAEILGVSEWDLMDYLGVTNVSDVAPLVGVSVKERLEQARRIFS